MYYIGVDGGGTKTAYTLFNENKEVNNKYEVCHENDNYWYNYEARKLAKILITNKTLEIGKQKGYVKALMSCVKTCVNVVSVVFAGLFVAVVPSSVVKLVLQQFLSCFCVFAVIREIVSKAEGK